MGSKYKPDCRPDVDPDVTDRCCNATTGCEWDGTLRDVVTEPIYVQKVYDATLINLQALSTVNNVRFSPNLPEGSRILRVTDIKCRKFFNPANINDSRNFKIDPDTVLSGGDFVRKENGDFVEVIGPDGLRSERLIYADTSECDEEGQGTPVFGTQRIEITGNVVVKLELLILDSRDRRRKFTVSANVPIGTCQTPIVLTNFFELCIPSVHDSAFFPRFTEFCNVHCEPRLGTNSTARDIDICPETGTVRVDLIIAICISCEKKIIVPVQLCVLSTGFPELSPISAPICSSFPTLFPRQIDENSGISPDEDSDCRRPKFKLGADKFEVEKDLEDLDFDED